MLSNEQLELASKTTYVSPMRYVSGRIVEYDIKSANINMLLKYNKISKQHYDYLSGLPKENREIDIGLLIKSDISYYYTIRDGIIEAKKNLFETNNINPLSVVRIANDAVYVNSSVDLSCTKFDNIEFKKKSVYNSMLILDKLIIFLWTNEDGINIDVKGMKREVQELHSEYMLFVIANTMLMMEKSSIENALSYLSQFIDDYINLKLPIGFYRELSPDSIYRLKYRDLGLIKVDDIHDIDINYNLYLLRELWSIILEKYNMNLKKRR